MGLTETNIDKIQVYNNLHKLPLARFIDVAVDEQFEALIISGNPSQLQLMEAWETIIDAYNNELSIGSMDAAHTISLYRSALIEETRMKALEGLLNILRRYYVKKFAEEVTGALQFNAKFDVTKPDEYDRDIDRGFKRLSGFRLRAEIAAGKLKIKLQKDNEAPVEKPTREWFSRILINLSDSAGFDLNEETMSVYKFCERIRRYNNRPAPVKATKRKAV